MDVEIRSAFNKFIREEEQTFLKAFFDSLNTEDGIMLQSYFEDFAKGTQSERIEKLETRLQEKDNRIRELEGALNNMIETYQFEVGSDLPHEVEQVLRKTEKRWV